MSEPALSGLRVLIVEDDPMIGILVEDMLLEEGCLVCGPCLTVAAAVKAAQAEAIDIALLDVNLGGLNSYPVGETLEARGIPFVLTSGYGDDAAPPEHPQWATCSKPYTKETLTSALLVALSDRAKLNDRYVADHHENTGYKTYD